MHYPHSRRRTNHHRPNATPHTKAQAIASPIVWAKLRLSHARWNTKPPHHANWHSHQVFSPSLIALPFLLTLLNLRNPPLEPISRCAGVHVQPRLRRNVHYPAVEVERGVEPLALPQPSEGRVHPHEAVQHVRRVRREVLVRWRVT